jgi:S-formylglutathione hydrolase FrmB
VYPTFLDISGDAEPSLGDLQTTIDAAFGGDAAALARVDPLDLLRTRTFAGSAGAIVAGSSDDDAKTTAHLVLQATRAGGMDTHYTEVPGRHDWGAARSALTKELPWLATRTGLIG